MPTSEPYAPFFAGLIDGPQVERLGKELVKIGMPRKWAHLAGRFVPPLNLWCLERSESGRLPSDPRRVAEIAGWPIPSKATQFVRAMILAGFIDGGARLGPGDDAEPIYHVHNFEHYLGPVLRERARGRRRRAAAKDPGGSTGFPTKAEPGPPTLNTDASADQSRPAQGAATPDASADPSADASADASAANVTKRNETERKFNVNAKGSLTTLHAHARERPSTAGPTAPLPPKRRTETAQQQRPQAVSEDAWERWNTFAELLRRHGWGEDNVRRIVRWALRDYRRGAWSEAPASHFWLILAWGLYVQRALRGGDGTGAPIRDPIALWIHCVTAEGDHRPNLPDADLTTARQGWEALEREQAGPPPAWLAQMLAKIGGKR